MGMKVQYKTYFPGYYSMKDLNDSNNCSWPLYYSHKSITNGQYYNRFFPTPTSETFLGDEKGAVKFTMLEHEAIFKNQVYELHRLYRIQRDMMDEIRRKELNTSVIQGDVSLSTKRIASEDDQRLHFTSFPLANSSTNRPSISGDEENTMKGFQRPTKVRRKLLDLQRPADEYIDSDEGKDTLDETAPAFYFPNKNDGACCSFSLKSNGLSDLNEPIKIEETNSSSYANRASFHSKTRVGNLSFKPSSREEITGNSKSKLPTSSKSSHSLDRSNEFFHGTSSGLNDGIVRSSSIGYDHPKFSSGKSRVFEKIREASGYFDSNSSNGIDLNVVHSNNSSNMGVHRSGFTIEDVKSRDGNHQSTIPWLKGFPSSKKKVLPQLMKSGSCSDEDEEERSEPRSKKLLEVLVFDESRTASETKIVDGRKTRSLDINLPFDPFISDTEASQNRPVAGFRHHIDLNLSGSDDEEVFEIDLEGREVPKPIDYIISVDEVVKMAADTIVSISSKNSIEEEEDESQRGMLRWFVDIVLNDKTMAESSDEFETMTLRLKEMAEEEYKPKPLFPDTIKFKESGNLTHTRPRKGPSRRGRHRRDFQRDILPGLTTLSRQEVTEDLQTFEGLMQATGHFWHSGVARRNSGGGRGRRRAVISSTQPRNMALACRVEIGLEDRSLTGWGKTTRRPRRQRIPAGNLHAVMLS